MEIWCRYHAHLYTFGICLSDSGSLSKPAAVHRLKKARQTLYPMRCKAARLGITVPGILANLFDSVVRPTMEYGVELWGTEFVTAADFRPQAGWEESNKFYLQFLRSILGLRPSTPYAVIIAEVGVKPLWCRWQELISRYWWRVWQLPADRLVRVAAQHSLEIDAAQDGDTLPRNMSWAGQIRRMFQLHRRVLQAATPEPLPTTPWIPSPQQIRKAAWLRYRK